MLCIMAQTVSQVNKRVFQGRPDAEGLDEQNQGVSGLRAGQTTFSPCRHGTLKANVIRDDIQPAAPPFPPLEESPKDLTPPIPAIDKAPAELTPFMRQWTAAKRENPDALLFFRMGDFYELFYDDAVTVSRELQLTLTARDRERLQPMCGVPYHAVENYLTRLLRKGCLLYTSRCV